MGQEALQKNGIKISFVSKHFYQGLYCYFSLSQVKLILFRPLTHFVLFLASFEGHVPFASLPGWGICTPLPHSGVFVWICWPHCWTMLSQEKLTNARGEYWDWLSHYCSRFALRIGLASGGQSWDPRITWSNSSSCLSSSSLTHLKSTWKICTLSWPSGYLLSLREALGFKLMCLLY